MAYNILLPEHNIHKKTHLPKSVIHSLSLFSPKWATCIHTMRRYTFYCFFYFDKRQKVDCLMNQHHKILSPFSIQEQLHRWLWHNHLDRLCHCINGRKHVSQASRQKKITFIISMQLASNEMGDLLIRQFYWQTSTVWPQGTFCFCRQNCWVKGWEGRM